MKRFIKFGSIGLAVALVAALLLILLPARVEINQEGFLAFPSNVVLAVGNPPTSKTTRQSYSPAEATYYFNSDGGAVGGKKGGSWADPSYFVDNILTNYTTTAADGNTQLLDGNTCLGTDLGTITKVELRAYGYGDSNDRIDLTPIFVAGNGDEHLTTPGTEAGWGTYQDITSDTNAPDWSSWTHIQTIDVYVEKDTVAAGATMYCSKVEIRVTYLEIDVGADPIDRPYEAGGAWTYIAIDNPANANGILHTVEVYIASNITGLRVGTFYNTTGNNYKCRDSEAVGDFLAGHHVITEDSGSDPLSITVETGDYIGCYFTDGAIDRDALGFAGLWRVIGEFIDPNDETEYGRITDDAISLYGYGDIEALAPPTVTTQAVTDIKATTATGNGNITDIGVGNCDKRGIVYGTTSKGNPGDVAPPGGYDAYEEETGSFGVGAFTKALTGLTPNETYYVRAYAHNADGYSYGNEVEFDTERRKNVLYALIALGGILSLISARSSFYPLKMVAGFAWFGTFVYWLEADLLTDGSPADTIIMLVLMLLGILFLFWGLAGRKGTVSVEDEVSDTGSIIKRIQKYTARNKEPEQGTESTLEYRKKVRKALSSGKTNRRK